jgi:hypothetical protein
MLQLGFETGWVRGVAPAIVALMLLAGPGPRRARMLACNTTRPHSQLGWKTPSEFAIEDDGFLAFDLYGKEFTQIRVSS